MGRRVTLERANHKSVRVDDSFWSPQLKKIREVTVWDVLTKFENDHEDGIMKNYERVVSGERGKHIGPPWYDGLICETIRGISDILAIRYDAQLDEKVKGYISKITAAQDKDPDGYINTYVDLICPENRWGENGGDALFQHELYDMGCLVEAGIHYYRAVGDVSLLLCGVKAANCMCKYIGPEPKKNKVPTHSQPEEAMVKLYRLFMDEPDLKEKLLTAYGVEVQPQAYLELVVFWMEHRGVHHNRTSTPKYLGEYAQDHCRIIEQSEAVGHAVRAALLYTGLAAVGIETGDERYLNTAKRLWDNVVQTKLHISGGIGAVHNEERFGFQYRLPNDAYLETCAGVALAFWAGEMHRAFGGAEYIDVFERALYNNILPGLSVDGAKYFYENPLISDGTVSRWEWHSCPCCPPMFLKIMSSLQDYIYSTGSDGVYVNLYIGSEMEWRHRDVACKIKQLNTKMPWAGSEKVVVHTESDTTFAVNLRVPEWARNFAAVIGSETYSTPDARGYVSIIRSWHDGDTIEINMDIPIFAMQAHPYVDADIGRVAIQRGPILYCVEGFDNQGNVDIILDKELHFTEASISISDHETAIEVKKTGGGKATLVPYYLWNNRDVGKMAVWLELEGYQASKLNTDGWDGKLYRVYQPQD